MNATRSDLQSTTFITVSLSLSPLPPFCFDSACMNANKLVLSQGNVLVANKSKMPTSC